MVPSNKRVQLKEKSSRQCVSYWWQLKEEHKKHFNLMKIHLLSPFLFSKVYQDKCWIEWAKSARILTQRRTCELDELSDDELQYTDLVELTMIKLQKEISSSSKNTTRITQYLEDIMDDIDSCCSSDDLKKVIACVQDKYWFKSVRSQIKMNFKLDEALFLSAWQLCCYIKAIYNGEKPLEVFERDSTIDESLAKSKQNGNEHFLLREYSKAISFYTSILHTKPFVCIIYGNRAACYLKMQEFRSAVSDGRRTTTLDPMWEKGQYRYAHALYEFGDRKTALDVLSKALDICEVKTELQALNERIKNELSNALQPIALNIVNHEAIYNEDSEEENFESSDEENISMLSLNYDSADNMPPLVTDDDTDEDSNVKAANLFKKSTSTKKVKLKTSAKEKNANAKETNSMQTILSDMEYYSKEGTDALLSKNFLRAVNKYQKCIDILKIQPEVFSPRSTIALLYSYATACFEVGFMEWNKAIFHYQQINKNFADFCFPLPYLGIGRVLLAQNRFQEAQDPLQNALELSSKPNALVNVLWPGSVEYIEESIPANLRLTAESLLDLCRHPPAPDALCRYLMCSLRTRAIYFNDPEFKGFICLQCTEHCLIKMHVVCWKKYKTEMEISKRELLSSKCLTPDCHGFVIKISLLDVIDGRLKDKWTDENKELKNKPCSKENQQKNLRQVKSDRNSNKGLKQQNVRKNEFINTIDKDQSRPQEMPQNRKDVQKEIKGFSEGLHEGVELVVLKNKNEESLFQPIKLKKTKSTKKKVKQKVTLEIPYQDHKSRTSSETHCKDQPALLTSDLPQKNFILDSSPFDIDCISDDFSEYAGLIPDPLGTALGIYQLFEELLEKKVMLDVHNSHFIIEFMNMLDENSKLLIEEVGGLRTFLWKCNKFSFDKKNRSVVYLSSEEVLFQVWKDRIQNNSLTLTPTSEEPLFDRNHLQMQTLSGSMNPYATEFYPKFTLPCSSRSSESESFSCLENDTLFCQPPSSLENSFTESSQLPNKKIPKDENISIKEDIDLATPLRDFQQSELVCDSGDDQDLPDLIEEVFIDTPLSMENVDSNYCLEENNLNELEMKLLMSVDPSKKSSVVQMGKTESIELFQMLLLKDAKRRGKQSSVEPLILSMDDERENNFVQFKSTSLSNVFESQKRNSIAPIQENMKISQKTLEKQLCNSQYFTRKNQTHNNSSSSLTLDDSQINLQNYKPRQDEFLNESTLEEDKVSNDKNLSVIQSSKSYTDLLLKGNLKNEIERVITSCTTKYLTNYCYERLSKDIITGLAQGMFTFCDPETSKVTKNIAELNENSEYRIEIDQNFEKLISSRVETSEKNCAVDIGVQAELGCKEYDEILRKNDVLINTNKALINERKLSQQQIEESANSLHNLSLKFNSMQDKLNNEIKEAHKLIEHLRKDFAQQQQNHQNESKRLAHERRELQNQIASLNLKLSEEQRLKSESALKDQKISKLEKELQELRLKNQHQGVEHEDIVHHLTISNTALSKRAEKVEVAFLKVNRDAVIAKYNHQAEVLNDVKRSIEKLPKTPDSLKICNNWEIYKKSFYDCYEKMIDEFNNLSDELKKGKSLEELPPAKYAEPPSLPASLNMNFNIPMHPQVFNSSVTPINNTSGYSATPHSPKPKDDGSPTSSNFASSKADMNESPVKGGLKYNKMFDRIILGLGPLFPNFSRDELIRHVKDYRRSNCGSLSGVKIDVLISNISEMIRRNTSYNQNNRVAKNEAHPTKLKTSAVSAPSKRTRANQERNQERSTWKETNKSGRKSTAVFGNDEACVICFAEMSFTASVTLQCGHLFHRECISCWLSEQRTCPICREYALLPDDFPTLS